MPGPARRIVSKRCQVCREDFPRTEEESVEQFRHRHRCPSCETVWLSWGWYQRHKSDGQLAFHFAENVLRVVYEHGRDRVDLSVPGVVSFGTDGSLKCKRGTCTCWWLSYGDYEYEPERCCECGAVTREYKSRTYTSWLRYCRRCDDARRAQRGFEAHGLKRCICGELFVPARAHKQFCSTPCWQENYHNKDLPPSGREAFALLRRLKTEIERIPT